MAWKLEPVGTARKTTPGDRSKAQSRPARPADRLIREETQTCAYCRGSGVIRGSVTCPICRGQGTVVHSKTPLVRCAFCRGRGERPPRSMITCAACRGRGFVAVVEPVETCPACRGRGSEPGNSNLPCGTCRGAGVVTVRPEQGGRMTVSGSERDLAEALLEKGPMGRWRLGREMRVSSAYAEFLCKSMLRKGALQPAGGGTYELAPGVREALQAKREQQSKRARRPRERQPEREQASKERGQIGPWVRSRVDSSDLPQKPSPDASKEKER